VNVIKLSVGDPNSHQIFLRRLFGVCDLLCPDRAVVEELIPCPANAHGLCHGGYHTEFNIREISIVIVIIILDDPLLKLELGKHQCQRK